MVEITLVEIHFDDAQFDANAEAIANAPLSGLRGLLGGNDEADAATEPESAATGTDESPAERGRPGPSLGKLFLAAVVLVLVAAVARRVLGGSEDAVESPDDDEVEIAEIDVGE